MSFKFSFLMSLFILIILIIIPIIAINIGLSCFLGVILPYFSLIFFILMTIFRVIDWGKSPVPFKIPTTCGQQKSLDWIKYDKLESPYNKKDVFCRMLLEILLFRSLFRNNKIFFYKDKVKLAYFSSKWLWLFAIIFHYSFLVIIIRHLRFFTNPTPSFIHFIEKIDSFFEVGVPIMYMSGVTLGIAILLLLLRRIKINKLRYISLVSDYFPLLLILSIVVTGILMRYFYRIDVVSIKELTMGLVAFNTNIPLNNIGVLFYIHLFLVCVLFIYLPFSKIMHFIGVFLSPTRNLANNSRAKSHINPWNPEVKLHTYEEYENEFRDKMKKAGIPVEKG